MVLLPLAVAFIINTLLNRYLDNERLRGKVHLIFYKLLFSLALWGVAIALAYLAIARAEGEEKVAVFARFVEAARKIVFRILEVLIDLTPYAVLCLIAGSASRLLQSWETMLQLLALMGQQEPAGAGAKTETDAETGAEQTTP